MAKTMKDDKLTDPYGILEYAVGSGDDFICFDYCVDDADQRIRLHAVLNSETGSFIQDFDAPQWVPFDQAIDAAYDMVCAALDWAADNDVRHSRKGWNQDPFYFVRCVRNVIHPTGKPVPRISKRDGRQP